MSNESERIEFTKEMKKDYTILFPNMLDIHFKMVRNIFVSYGYKAAVLEDSGQKVIDEGLKHVHNDTCYPALVTIGQMMHALKSKKYDANKTALMMFQTGGGCRASNYVYLIRKALKQGGMPQVPVVSFNISGIEKNSGFKITLAMMWYFLAAISYGDMLMLLSNQTRPYEVEKGETDRLVDKWVQELSKKFMKHRRISLNSIKQNYRRIAESFAEIKTVKTPKVKVGIVGEVYVQYSSIGNNGLERFLHEQGCEVMVPGISGFLLSMLDKQSAEISLYGGNRLRQLVLKSLRKFFSQFEDMMLDAVRSVGGFTVPTGSAHTKKVVSSFIGLGCGMGEGWTLPAEMLELTELGYENIVCTQPFGCLPNHIVAKGMFRKMKERFPESNIVAIDYDPGATRVNQENRIKLMLSIARERLAVAPQT